MVLSIVQSSERQSDLVMFQKQFWSALYYYSVLEFCLLCVLENLLIGIG